MFRFVLIYSIANVSISLKSFNNSQIKYPEPYFKWKYQFQKVTNPHPKSILISIIS